MMPVDDLFHHRESDAQPSALARAPRVGAPESREHHLGFVGRKADARILHDNLVLAVLSEVELPGLETDGIPRVGILDGVRQQIVENLDDLFEGWAVRAVCVTREHRLQKCRHNAGNSGDDADLSIGKSPSQKEKSGKTFGELVKNVRMKKARTLLKGGNMTVETIAEKVGYQNVEHFTRLFKKKYGMTPVQFRNEDK